MCFPLTMQNGIASLQEWQSSDDSGIMVEHDGQGAVACCVQNQRHISVFGPIQGGAVAAATDRSPVFTASWSQVSWLWIILRFVEECQQLLHAESQQQYWLDSYNQIDMFNYFTIFSIHKL